MKPKIIAFDADDTLFVNEPYFQEVEQQFCVLMSDYLSQQGLSQELFKTEIENLTLYGYGIKGYILSMIEAAMKISNNTVSIQIVEKIIQLGKELLQKPIELLPGVLSTLQALQPKYKLVVATKGDLKDQQSKLHRSGLSHYFHHIEVMSDKHEINYQHLLTRLEIQPQDFLMIGNSLKSDIVPVLNLGGFAFHIPFHTTWEHEKIAHTIEHPNFKTLTTLEQALSFID